MPKASWAVTVKLKALPAVAPAGVLSTRRLAAAALTVTGLLVPRMALVAVSVAVSVVWLPAVLSVALKVPTPLAIVLLAGTVAAASLLENRMVPA